MRFNYNEWVYYLESTGWFREQITIDEYNYHLVQLFDVAANNIGTAIDIITPAYQKIIILGVEEAGKASKAHALRIRFSGIDGVEIPLLTSIRLVKQNTAERQIPLANITYIDANLKDAHAYDATYKTDFGTYRMRNGVILNGNEHLKIIVLNKATDNFLIDSSKTKFALDLDLWSHDFYLNLANLRKSQLNW